jgi:hypothetical protein
MECLETCFVGDDSAKKAAGMKKAARENSSTSPQERNDFNRIKPNIRKVGRLYQ